MNTRTLQDIKEDKTMCALYRKFIGFLTTVCLTIGSAGPAYADDTEIYFGGAVNSNARPNILLILDTSSSMKKDFESSTRIEVMKEVMLDVIRTVENVNLGVMIFNKGGDGGHISYPITYIDKDLTDATITRVVSDGADDGEEDLATGNVVLNANPLVTSTALAGVQESNVYAIANKDDDGDEFYCSPCLPFADGWYTFVNTEQYLALDPFTASRTAGMLFRGTNIPIGSRIDAATLTLIHDKSKGFEQGTGTITGEKVSAPGKFLSLYDAFVGQFDQRRKLNPTTNTATIKTLTSTNAGDPIDADVTAVIDELVSDTTWNAAGPIALYMHNAAGNFIDFFAWSDNSDPTGAKAAKLTVTHTNPATVTTDKLLGFRFTNLQLPQGTVVTNARLTLTAALTSTGNSTYLISGEVPDAVDGSSDPFVAGAGGDLSGRPKTTKVPWTLGFVDDNDPYVSPNISGVVNQIVGNGNWCGGNDLTIFVEREAFSADPSRAFYPAEVNSTELMPTLELEYDPATANGCFVATESAAISSDDDDTEEDGGDVDNGSGDLDVSDKIVGLRFTDIDVPNGAEIISARITLVADDDNTSSVNVTIDGELTGDALIFDEDNTNDVSNRTRTSAQVNWSVPDYVQGSGYDTPDLSDIVREITSQGTWASGNAMAFIINNASGNRPTVSHDDSPGNAARLEIQYRSTSGASLIRTARDEILDFVSAIVAGSGTPIVEVMFEAAQYWTGGEVIWGASRWNDEFNRLSIDGSYTGGTVTWPAGCTPDDMGADACDAQIIDPTPTKPFYISPFTSDLACQKNYQVLLTDGSANNNDAGADQIRTNYLGGPGASCITEYSNGDSVDYSDEECGVDLVKHMYENDLDGSLANDQTVITNTVGFTFSDQFLRDMALEGGGNFYESNSSAELAAAFTQFFGSVRNLPTSIVAPSLASNSFNRLLSRDEVYFGLFTPFVETRWPGNVKKYNVCIDSTTGCNLGDILDANGNVATDAQNRFKSTSQSLWSDTAPVPVVDGIETTEGGAGAQLDDFANDRLIYTDVTNTGAAPAVNKSLGDSGFFFDATNWNAAATTKIRDEICGVGADISAGSACESLMLWVLGSNDYDADADEDVSATTRWTLNDVLHSSPRVITYGGRDNDADGIIDVYFDKVMVGTNEGGLRFFNGVTGKEEWTFMPKKLLGQQDILQTNAQGNHLYGIDSTPTLYSKDVDFDGVIEPADGDFVNVVTGMRRGGSNYYALNLSASLASEASQVTPRFLWRIQGGTAGDYARMGQTWSEPVVTTMKTGGTGFASDGVNTPVLIVGGGYDDALDTSFGTLGTGGVANKGNAIYFVDPADGTLIFSISGPGSGADIEVPGMLYSIAAEPTVADTDGDGDDDRVFIADTAGNIWRVDLGQDVGAGGDPEGSTIVGQLASLSDPSVAADQRMFFEKIAFVQVKDSTYSDAANGEYDYIMLGSGTRPDPLNTTVNDRFYGIRDRNISPMTDSNADNLAEDYPSAAGPIDNSTLVDITSTILDPTSSAHTGGDGWYYDFVASGSSGEKVMAQARVVAGTVVFTTYSPDAVSSSNDACAPNIGGGFAYNFNILNGKATLDWDTDGTIEDFADRKLALGGGIPSEVVPVFTEEGVVGIVGVEGGAAKVGTLAGVPRVRTYWYEEVY
jgi:type IV pilus assembly protein PilY1